MRIGIMLQSLHHFGGIGIYTRNIVQNLLNIDKSNEYVLIYPSFGKSHTSFGKYKNCDNVTEVLSYSIIPHAYYWDHVVVPSVVRKYNIDLVFNPFLSVPLRGRCKKIFVLHGIEWFTMPEVFWFSARVTGRYRMKAIMNAADKIIAISHTMVTDCVRAINISESKFKMIYHGIGEEFRVIKDTEELSRIREKYHLPDKFILFVGGLYPQKNLRTLIEAFSLMVGDIPHQLVVAGNGRWKYKDDLKLITEKKLENRIQMLGWVPPEDVPFLYNLADCFVYPGLDEMFGLCLVEAMACGCPVVASTGGALPEVAQEAAILVDPKNHVEMQKAILRIISHQDVRQQLIHKGVERARDFSWNKCAAETLKAFYEIN